MNRLITLAFVVAAACTTQERERDDTLALAAIPAQTSQQLDQSRATAIVQAASRVAPAVVSVNVLTTQAVQHSLAKQSKDQPVDVVKDVDVFDTNAGQLVDIEEAAVVDVVCCDPKVRQTPKLLLDQRVKPAPAGEIAGIAIELGHCGVDFGS